MIAVQLLCGVLLTAVLDGVVQIVLGNASGLGESNQVLMQGGGKRCRIIQLVVRVLESQQTATAQLMQD